MRFEILADQPALRPEINREPPAGELSREERKTHPYYQVMPGLYTDETVVRLDTGELVAISVWTNLVGNDGVITGGGMEFRGWARLILPNGETMRDPAGQEMELESTFAPNPLFIESRKTDTESGEDRISREILRLMLGEEPTMIPIEVDPDAPPPPEIAVDIADFQLHPEKAPPGTVLNPGATETPLVGWDAETRMNGSIRHAITMLGRATGSAGADVAALLASG